MGEGGGRENVQVSMRRGSSGWMGIQVFIGEPSQCKLARSPLMGHNNKCPHWLLTSLQRFRHVDELGLVLL